MSARSCADVRAYLSEYLEGDLDGASAEATRVHLERCAECRLELEQLRLTSGALQRLPDLPPPAAILAGVRARLRPEPWYRHLLAGRGLRFTFPLGAAATVLVVIGVAFFAARHPEIPRTVSEPMTRGVSDLQVVQERARPAAAPTAVPPASVRDHRVGGMADTAPPPAARIAAAEREASRTKTVQPLPRREPAVEARTPTVSKTVSHAETQAASPAPSHVAAKAKGASEIRMICQLAPGGLTLDELKALLGRSGAVGTAVTPLATPAVRAAYARQRGRLDDLPEPAQGWEVTAAIPENALPGLLKTLNGSTGVRILEQPAATAAATTPRDLHITVFR
jgi:hypothetical protein